MLTGKDYYQNSRSKTRVASMKVFLSWSGPTSKRIALALHEWLPSVIQTIKPWMSSEDIKKGARWSPAIQTELAESRAAIFCITPDNFGEPWLNFEAGAVSNTPWSANVCTYLVGASPTDITGPLTQFQATVATSKEDSLKLLETINSAQENGALDKARLEKAFNKYWPELEAELTKISEIKLPHVAKRALQDIAEEILTLVRGLQIQSVSSPYFSTPNLDRLAYLGAMKSPEQDQVFFMPGVVRDDPLTGETVNTGRLYRARREPPPIIPPRKSDKPKDK
jgi:hypothetical protein